MSLFQIMIVPWLGLCPFTSVRRGNIVRGWLCVVRALIGLKEAILIEWLRLCVGGGDWLIVKVTFVNLKV